MHGVTFALVLNPEMRQHTKIYLDAKEYGWSWFILSLPVLILIHDTYFYWMHRTLHHPKLYRHFHLIHHESNPSTPLASQSFHPYETIFELIWVIPVIFMIPLYLPIIIAFSFFSLIYNIYGHSNIDFYPKSWNDHKLLKWLNTSSAHQEHHRKFEGNYGLYFSFWDRWQQTLRKSTTP
jgi:sterol desaturase/sphingolipid hydroxylase (fatty acid hydroxylase superfamily)